MVIRALRVVLTSFVGREAELVVVERLLVERRLVTLIGTGGCGKTRMVTELGQRIGERWADGWSMIDLGAVTNGAQVPRLVAAALGVFVDPDRDPVQALTAQLRARTLVICLDTCEHLLASVALLVDVLLRACPDVTMLATSREPLGVEGETVWRVPPLRREEAVRLFADRAALVAPGFDLEAVAGDVARVCARVDDIPLGVELAAAWVGTVTPAQIATDLNGSLQRLAGSNRAAPPRQQTLLASMEWSHGLLGAGEQAMLRRLAVFAGMFTLEAVADVSGEPEALPLVRRLLDTSLVVAREGRGRVRYRLLDTVRDYAMERLREAGEEDETRDRHLRHYRSLAERAAAGLEEDQDTWRLELESHRDDIDVALQWGLGDGQPSRGDEARRLAVAMARQWFLRGQAADGHRFLGQAIALRPEDRSALQARLYAADALLAMVSGRADQIVDSVDRGRRLAEETGDEVARSRCVAAAAYLRFFSDFAESEALAREAWGLADPWASAVGGMLLGYTLQTRSRLEEAEAVSDRVHADSRLRRDRLTAGFARGVRSYTAVYNGRVSEAVTVGREAAATVSPLADYFAVGTLTCHAAHLRALSGDLSGAQEMLEPVVLSMVGEGDVDVVGFMVVCGSVSLWEGDLDGAVGWFELGLRRLDTRERDWTAVRCMPGLVAALRRLGRLDEAAALATRAVTMVDAFDAPFELSQLVDEQALLLAGSDPRRARELLLEALTLRRDFRLRLLYVDSLDALAGLKAADDPDDAVRLLAVADAARAAMPYPRPPVAAPQHDALVAALRDTLTATRFAELTEDGARRSLDDTVAALTRGRGRRDRPSTGWSSLTPAEVDLAMLVREGLSNPDIATRLYVSRSTVKAHLSHIYAKLGIANRTALAAAADAHAREGA
jgi:predicted ATPase/DNA-binding CsgD family transcriptional regulator